LVNLPETRAAHKPHAPRALDGLPLVRYEGIVVEIDAPTTTTRAKSGDSSPVAAPAHQALPASAQALVAPVKDLADALEATRELAHSHYENFSVVSMLLPKHLRQDFCNVYAFCRIADDLGDEIGDRDRSLELLKWFGQLTRECYAGRAGTALFVALAETIRKFDVPIQPFLDLIDAFEQDQRVVRYDTFEQVLDYCRRSADPVGRLVLYMCGYRDETRQRLADKVCTGLQLVNFWQDVRRDVLERDRIYLPRESMERFDVSESQIRDGRCDENYRRLIQFEVDRAERFFNEGEELLDLLDRGVRPQISLFSKGGRAIIAAIRRQGYDTLGRRPRLSKWQKARLVLAALVGSIASRRWRAGREQGSRVEAAR
jgi:squalene synthase HpnC